MRCLLLLLTLGCDPEGKGWSGGGSPNTETGPGNSLDDTGEETGGETAEPEDTAPPEGSGYQKGDVAYDLAGVDQDGADWSLYGLLGQDIVLLAGHMDFGATVSTMNTLSEVSAAFPQAEIVALIGRDELSIAADQDDAARWAEEYSLDTALVDPLYSTVNLWSESSSAKTYVIAPDMTISLVIYGPATFDQVVAGL